MTADQPVPTSILPSALLSPHQFSLPIDSARFRELDEAERGQEARSAEDNLPVLQLVKARDETRAPAFFRNALYAK
jgi:hypothetical protein